MSNLNCDSVNLGQSKSQQLVNNSRLFKDFLGQILFSGFYRTSTLYLSLNISLFESEGI